MNGRRQTMNHRRLPVPAGQRHKHMYKHSIDAPPCANTRNEYSLARCKHRGPLCQTRLQHCEQKLCSVKCLSIKLLHGLCSE
jgi:hypothetical protein